MDNKEFLKLENFERYLREKGLSENTVRAYVHAIETFKKYQKNKTLTKQAVRGYEKSIRESYRITTVNLYLTALNQYLLFCDLGEYCVKIKAIQRRKRAENVLDRLEYQKLLYYVANHGDWKYYAILKTLAGTGIRISELKYITTDTVRIGMAQVYNKGKTREIYMGASLRSELEGFCKSNRICEGVVFRGNGKGPITRGAINQKLLKIAEGAGVEKRKVHPHAFRHLFAKEYMNRYRNIAELSCILGHESVETTMIYLANSSREYMERLDGLAL